MADISKCIGFKCPLKKTCYRFTAISSDFWQAWADFRPAKVNNKWTCEGYWNNKNYGTQKKRTK